MFECYEVWNCDADEAIEHMEENYPECDPIFDNSYDSTHIEWCAYGRVIATFYEGTLNVYS